MPKHPSASGKVCSRGHEQRGLNFCPECNPGRAHRVALVQVASEVDHDADRLYAASLQDRWAEALRFVRRITPFSR